MDTELTAFIEQTNGLLPWCRNKLAIMASLANEDRKIQRDNLTQFIRSKGKLGALAFTLSLSISILNFVVARLCFKQK